MTSPTAAVSGTARPTTSARPRGRGTVIDLTGPASKAGSNLKSPATEVAKPVLSVAEAAELLGVSEWLVLQQIQKGELPHKRCGRRIVLSRDRLMAWINDV
jgi:excisionase family DNA binding protein